MENSIPLSATIMIGGILESIFLSVACKNPELFNKSECSPKEKDNDDKVKVKLFPDWSLNNSIDVSYDIGMIQLHTKEHSHTVREFRNYIHPHQQLKCNFTPSTHTAELNFKVLEIVIYDITQFFVQEKL